MDRKEAIEILQKEIVCLNHPMCIDCPNYKGCDPICTTPYDSEYIEAYKMAIQALEVNEVYQLEYEKTQAKTNGEMIKAMFPCAITVETRDLVVTDIDMGTVFEKEWWNAPYKGAEP